MGRTWSARTVGMLVVSLLLVSTAVASAAPPSDRGGAQRVAIIGVFHDDVEDPGAQARDLGRRHGGAVTSVYGTVLRGFAGEFPADALPGLERDRRVAYVERDAIATIAAQTPSTGARRSGVTANDNLVPASDPATVVDADIAVLDTGVDLDHPDLEVVAGVDCLDGTCVTGGDDDHGHGTHVAGIAAARNNDLGVVGVAPGARVHPVKVLDASGSGSFAGIIAGIEWATVNGMDVVNMSLGCLDCGELTSVHEAIANSVAAGVVHVVAAGNSGVDASRSTPGNDPNVITVSALADFDGEPGGAAGCRRFTGGGPPRTQCDDHLAHFSNHGPEVEIAAPGWAIQSTVPGGGYESKSGTSMAAPHVAGAAAVLASQGMDVTQTTSTLLETGNANWVDDVDGTEEPLLDVADETTFDPATVGEDVDPAPTVTLEAPADGATVSGLVTVSATASDGTTSVTFLVDDTEIDTDTDGGDGWSTDWDTTSVADGTHTLTATATDTADQSSSDTVTVAVDNVDDAPTVAVVAPDAGSTLAGSVTLRATATDDRGVAGVEFFVDGTTWLGEATDTGDGWSLTWDTTAVEDGSHALTAVATDTSARQATSEPVEVAVDNTSRPLAIDTVTPSSVEVGRHVVTVAGAGFEPGVTVTLENGRGHTPTIESVTWVDDSTLKFGVLVESKGPTSDWDVRVTNPDGASIVAAAALRVVR